jgi:hypothetical protein
MIDNGDNAITSASGTRSVSTDPQLPDIDGLSSLDFSAERSKPGWRDGGDRAWSPFAAAGGEDNHRCDRPFATPNFKHIDSDGQLLDRAAEIASLEKVSGTMNPSEQVVDIPGDTAVIHGVNPSSTTARRSPVERFTDVFVLQNVMWLAVSAQGTTLG